MPAPLSSIRFRTLTRSNASKAFQIAKAWRSCLCLFALSKFIVGEMTRHLVRYNGVGQEEEAIDNG